MQHGEPRGLDMRIYKHEDSGFQGRIGATATARCEPRVGGLPPTSRREVSGRVPQHGLPLDESVPPWRRRSVGGTRSHRTTAKAHGPTGTSGLALVRALADT